MNNQDSVGFTIRSLSNLLRRKMMELAPPPGGREGPTETGGMIMGYICDRADQEIYQRDLEKAFCIRRSTASHFLRDLERDGMVLRQSVARDARLKRLVPTPRAMEGHQIIESNIRELEAVIQRGLSPEELAQFLATSRKIMQNLQ